MLVKAPQSSRGLSKLPLEPGHEWIHRTYFVYQRLKRNTVCIAVTVSIVNDKNSETRTNHENKLFEQT